MHKGIFKFVTEIQDEVHRFSVEYHRKKHTKSALENSLTQIKGVGEKKAKNLIVKFRTIDNIRSASIEDLEKKKDTYTKKILKYIIYKYNRN